MSNKELVIGGNHVLPGETMDFRLQFSESYLGIPVSLPVRVVRALKPGPVVFLTGAVHGDELTGVGIIRELVFNQLPPLLKGALVFVPIVNAYGLENHVRYLADRRDLNRCFPGMENGSPSSRLAYALYNDVVRNCDFGIDFHSAAVRRTNYPNIRADIKNPAVRKLARQFGIELIVHGKGPEDSLRRTAVKNGIPTIVLEAGEVWKNEPTVVEIGVRGTLNLLKALEMIEGKPQKPLFQLVIEKTTWVRSQRSGFLTFYAKPGDIVAEGQLLAITYSLFGKEQDPIYAPCHGIILGISTMPAVKPGEPVYHIAYMPVSTYRRISKNIEDSDDGAVFHRVQEDLSTSISIQEVDQEDDIDKMKTYNSDKK